MLSLGAQRVEYIAESAQALVDGLCLLQRVARCLRFGEPLRAGEVHEVDHAAELLPRLALHAGQLQAENGVAARGDVVHGGGRDGAVARSAFHEGRDLRHAGNRDLGDVGDRG